GAACCIPPCSMAPIMPCIFSAPSPIIGQPAGMVRCRATRAFTTAAIASTFSDGAAAFIAAAFALRSARSLLCCCIICSQLALGCSVDRAEGSSADASAPSTAAPSRAPANHLAVILRSYLREVTEGSRHSPLHLQAASQRDSLGHAGAPSHDPESNSSPFREARMRSRDSLPICEARQLLQEPRMQPTTSPAVLAAAFLGLLLAPAARAAELAGDPGRAMYLRYCSACHGPARVTASRGPS